MHYFDARKECASMTKAATLTLASQMTLGQIQGSLLSTFYDDAINALGALPYLFQSTLVSLTPGQSLVSYPQDAINPLSLWYDTRDLDLLTNEELMAINPRWPDDVITPLTYTLDSVPLRTLTLYPRPSWASDPIPITDPFGPAFPRNCLTFLGTTFMQDIIEWLELPILFGLLAREYARESPHKDLQFASACQRLATTFMDYLTLPMIQ